MTHTIIKFLILAVTLWNVFENQDCRKPWAQNDHRSSTEAGVALPPRWHYCVVLYTHNICKSVNDFDLGHTRNALVCAQTHLLALGIMLLSFLILCLTKFKNLDNTFISIPCFQLKTPIICFLWYQLEWSERLGEQLRGLVRAGKFSGDC